MNIKFSLATNDVSSEILEMMSDFYTSYNYPFDRLATEKNLGLFISDLSLGRAWTINDDNRIMGYIVLTFGFSFERNGKDAFIDELFIKPEFRLKGLGRQAMDFVEKEARHLGVNAIHLEVEKYNQVGMNLYLGMGYADNDRLLLTKKIQA